MPLFVHTCGRYVWADTTKSVFPLDERTTYHDADETANMERIASCPACGGALHAKSLVEPHRAGPDNPNPDVQALHRKQEDDRDWAARLRGVLSD